MDACHSHIRSVLVVGAGLMGSRIALLFASRGYPVALTDVDAKVLAGARRSSAGASSAWPNRVSRRRRGSTRR